MRLTPRVVRDLLKKLLVQVMSRTFGRRRFALISRSLWMSSRLDVPNDPFTNGEVLLQSAILHPRDNNRRTVILDVGSNTGQWAHFIYSVIKPDDRRNVELHVFEPAPAAFAALKRNLSTVGASVHVTYNQLALSNFNGSADFSIMSPLSQINTLAALDEGAVKSTVSVKCTSLDSYCFDHSLDQVFLVKIDTEGNDYRVLEGAKGLLEHGRVEYIQFEYNHRWIAFRNYLKDVFDFLRPFDYCIGKITPKGIEFYATWHPDLEKFIEGNYLICKNRERSQLPSVPYWNQ